MKALGAHSAALARLTPGTRVWAEGPYGALTARNTGAGRGARAYYSVGDEPAGHELALTAPCLTALVPDLGHRDVYPCGPPGMTEAAGAALRGAGVAPHRIHQESSAL